MPSPRRMLVGEITVTGAKVHWSEIEISPALLHAMVVEEEGTLTYWIPELPPLPVTLSFQAAGGKPTTVVITDATPAASARKGAKRGRSAKDGEAAVRRDVTVTTASAR
ncbi:MAG TPA: hypothetical protein VEL07_06860 [Planctomycetota bacterium]|nr:hypothetical protein [Planctomycetota bacterium]